MSSAFGFRELLSQVERKTVPLLELEPLLLPAELSSLSGQFRGEPAELRARAYSGPRHAYVRFVELTGTGLEIANLLYIARSELELPVFGADLVALGKETAVVVADLSPMSDDPARRELERMAIARCATAQLDPALASPLPEWAQPWFSKQAVCVRVGSGDREAALQAVAEMAEAFLQLSLAEPVPAQQSSVASASEAERRTRRGKLAQRQEAYSAAHRADDRGLLLLRRIFEPTVADRFLREVLFPQRIPA